MHAPNITAMMRVQPSSKQEAEQQYVGQPVRKYFEADDDFEASICLGHLSRGLVALQPTVLC